MRFRAGVLIAVLFGLAGAVSLIAQDPVPVVVQVKLVDGRIMADPDPAEVTLGGVMSWDVQSAEKDEVSVSFAEQRGVKGPFAPMGTGAVRGQFGRTGPGEVRTGVADQLPVDEMGRRKESQEWKYSVTWKSGGKTIQVDPIVRVKGGGG